MRRLLDIENWERRDHFNFFRKFEEPFWGVTVEINCTLAYDYCKKNSLSFFLYYLHKSLVAANFIEPFRYRIADDRVYVYNTVNASPTINRDNGTFGFAYMDYIENFDKFYDAAKHEIVRIKSTSGLVPAISGENVIHYSSMPWINFSSMSHARSFSFPDSCPKITFGKMIEKDGQKVMPVSVHVHHALMDGYHVGLFIDKYQELMNHSEL
ncbi:MAG: CatA-like O-acetyltransferase [Bacteroidales bacterium]